MIWSLKSGYSPPVCSNRYALSLPLGCLNWYAFGSIRQNFFCFLCVDDREVWELVGVGSWVSFSLLVWAIILFLISLKDLTNIEWGSNNLSFCFVTPLNTFVTIYACWNLQNWGAKRGVFDKWSKAVLFFLYSLLRCVSSSLICGKNVTCIQSKTLLWKSLQLVLSRLSSLKKLDSLVSLGLTGVWNCDLEDCFFFSKGLVYRQQSIS